MPKKPPKISVSAYFKHKGAYPAETLLALLNHYGPVFRLPFRGRFIVADPKFMQHILLTNRNNYSKDLGDYRMLDELLGSGLLTSIGPRWQGMRALLQPLFHLREMPRYTEMTSKVVLAFCKRWDKLASTQTPVDMTKEMTALSMMMSAECLLGVSYDFETASKLVDAFFVQHKAICQSGAPKVWLPIPSILRFHKARRFSLKHIKALVANCKQTPGFDVISLMQAANNPATNAPYTEQDLIDQASTFLGTGHETTGTGMAWAWYCLANNPDYYQKLLDEVDHVLGPSAPGYEQLAELTYTKQVFQEAIRLYPPIWVVPRTAIRKDVIEGYKMPARAKLSLMIYGLHRLEQYWQAPNQFNPDRFAKETKEKRHKYAYLPFGAGPHVCVASLLSQVQAQVAMSLLAKHYRLSLVSKKPVTIETLITLKPKEPILMTIHKRG